MDDRTQLYNSLSNVAWGYFFLSLDINLNNVSILPKFVGFMMLLSAIETLSKERRDLALLRPLCILLAAWRFGDWALSWFGWELDGKIMFLDLLTAAAELYFHFQFLTDMAALAAKYQTEGAALSRSVLRQRRAYTLLVTAVALTGSLSQVFPWEWWGWVVLAAAIPSAIVGLCIMASMFDLRRCVKEGGGVGPQLPE